MTENTLTIPAGDYIVRGTAAQGMIRALAITAPETVRAARDAHGLSAGATAAVGRLMMAAQMMGWLLKAEGEQLSLMVRCTADLGGMTVTADSKGSVKGYADNPAAQCAFDLDGQPDVASMIASGDLTVVRTSPYLEPYVSQIALVSGTINDDLTAYYILSEQIPTIVNVTVSFDSEGAVTHAGGYFIQLMPGYEDALLDQLQRALQAAPSVSGMLADSVSPTQMLERCLEGMDFKPYEYTPAAFRCDCSRERSERTLLSLGASELRSLIGEGQPVDIKCDYCSTTYHFTMDELEALAQSAQ